MFDFRYIHCTDRSIEDLKLLIILNDLKMTQEVDKARIYNFTRGRTREGTDLAATCVITSLNTCVRWQSEWWLDT
jgi:hypothetical protein